MRNNFFDRSNKYLKDSSSIVQVLECNSVNSPQEYLGSVDAKTEWSHDPLLARHKFLHTEAYTKFLNDDALILIGRTGVGKTAILLCIEDDINKQDENAISCSYVVNIDCNDILNDLAKLDGVFSQTPINASNEIKRIINIIIKTGIMRKIIEIESKKKLSRFKLKKH